MPVVGLPLTPPKPRCIPEHRACGQAGGGPPSQRALKAAADVGAIPDPACQHHISLPTAQGEPDRQREASGGAHDDRMRPCDRLCSVGKRVILVDAESAQPTLAARVRLIPSNGLTNERSNEIEM